MLPSVLHPVCMSKNYWCRKETKKKQAEHERITQQSRAKHKWCVFAFKNHPLEHQDTVKYGVISSHWVFTCVNFANSFIKVYMKVARGSETCWLNKAGNIHISVLDTVKVSLQPGPSQGCIWFSRFQLQTRLTSTALHIRQRPEMVDKGLIQQPLALVACWGHPGVKHWRAHTGGPAWRLSGDFYLTLLL